MMIEPIRTVAAGGPYGPARIQSLALDASGHLFVGDHGTKKVHIWDATTGDLVDAITVRLEDVSHLAVTRDGRYFAAGGSSAAVWDTQAKRSLFKLGKGPNRLVFSPTGELVAAACGKALQVWSTTDGKLVHKVKHRRGVVRDLAFDPTGPRLVAALEDEAWDYGTNRMAIQGELAVVDLETGKLGGPTVPLEDFPLIAATEAGLLLRRIPQINAKAGATRGGPGEAWRLGLDAHTLIEAPSTPPTMSVRAIAPLGDGRIVTLELLGDDAQASPASDVRVIRVWDLSAGTVAQAELDEAVFGRPLKMAATPDGVLAFDGGDRIHLARIA